MFADDPPLKQATEQKLDPSRSQVGHVNFWGLFAVSHSVYLFNIRLPALRPPSCAIPIVLVQGLSQKGRVR